MTAINANDHLSATDILTSLVMHRITSKWLKEQAVKLSPK